MITFNRTKSSIYFLKCLIHELKGKVSNNVAKILEEIMDEKPSI